MQLTTFARLAVALFATASASAQLRLTDLFQFSADSSGNAAGGQLWDTQTGGSFAIWVSANGNRLNGLPADLADATIDYTLTEGVHEFQIWGQPGSATAIDFAAMNLFFDDSNNAGISVFAPSQTAQGPATGFVANGAASTFGPGGAIPGAGSLSFSDGGMTITLTRYFYSNRGVYGFDEGIGNRRTPGLGTDFYGEFTLEVVPAPATPAVIAGAGLLASRRRR